MVFKKPFIYYFITLFYSAFGHSIIFKESFVARIIYALSTPLAFIHNTEAIHELFTKWNIYKDFLTTNNDSQIPWMLKRFWSSLQSCANLQLLENLKCRRAKLFKFIKVSLRFFKLQFLPYDIEKWKSSFSFVLKVCSCSFIGRP